MEAAACDPFNPVYAVELEPEETLGGPAVDRGAGQAIPGNTQDKPLGLVFRLVVLRGARRGEDLGLRRVGANLDEGYLNVERTVLQHAGTVTEGPAKTKAGERRIYLDAATVAMLKAHRRAQLADRLRASTAWQDNDLIFCRADGSP